WRGIDAAPSLDFYYDEGTYYHAIINAYRDAGFAVIMPGWRGHGTVDGRAADGLAFMAAWDQGSYLSPVFYAIDVMNLIDGLPSLGDAPLDLDRITLVAHSQGGDVALTVMAVADDDATTGLRQSLHGVSIWNGLIAPRLQQARVHGLLQGTALSYLSGDGTWTGTAVAPDGRANPDFVFGWPPEWVDPAAARAVSDRQQIQDVLIATFTKLYDALRKHVDNLGDAEFGLDVPDGERVAVLHDPRVVNGYAAADPSRVPERLNEPLTLHFSDRDMYSLPRWNRDLCASVNAAGGDCRAHEYEGNTHLLGLSDKAWFSNASHRAGFDQAVARDAARFGVRSAR
ncbi:MAG: hypothetical protein AAF610_06550, partial [Pseudomonadota bacterium]